MGAPELLVILVLVVLIFGASKIPELGKSIGEGLTNLKKGLREGEEASVIPPPQAPPARLAAPPVTPTVSSVTASPTVSASTAEPVTVFDPSQKPS